MNIETNLVEDYVNFVDTSTKQNTYLTRIINFLVVIISLFLIFLLINYLNELHLSSTTNIYNWQS